MERPGELAGPAPGAIWSRTSEARRFGREIVVVIALKAALLTLLWWVAIQPAPRADTSPAAVAKHLVAPPADRP
jgi:hypothetical protein